MNAVEMKKALKNRERLYGTLVVSPFPRWCDVIGNIGLDFVFIDTEHVPLNRTDVSCMCKMYNGMGLSTLVRIPEPDPYRATMAIDAGANAVMAPYIETVDQVKKLVGAVKYRPYKGAKLQAILDGTLKLSEKEQAYLDEFNRGNMLFLNIESVEGINHIEDFMAVGGIDGLIVGPHDLSLSIGRPEEYNSKEFDDRVCQIIEKSKKCNVSMGVHFSNGIANQIEWAKKGANIILNNSDITGFANYLKNDFDTIKKAIGDEAHGNDAQVII